MWNPPKIKEIGDYFLNFICRRLYKHGHLALDHVAPSPSNLMYLQYVQQLQKPPRMLLALELYFDSSPIPVPLNYLKALHLNLYFLEKRQVESLSAWSSHSLLMFSSSLAPRQKTNGEENQEAAGALPPNPSTFTWNSWILRARALTVPKTLTLFS